MDIINTDVLFEDFVVLRSEMKFQYQPEDSNDVDLRGLFKKYLVNIDFGFRHEQNHIFAFVKTSVNQADQPLAGYQLFCEAMAVVELRLQMDKNDLANVEHSALFFAINQSRAFLMNLTSYGNLGRYVLPAIDLDKLIKQKAQADEKREGSKRKSRKVSKRAKSN